MGRITGGCCRDKRFYIYTKYAKEYIGTIFECKIFNVNALEKQHDNYSIVLCLARRRMCLKIRSEKLLSFITYLLYLFVYYTAKLAVLTFHNT